MSSSIHTRPIYSASIIIHFESTSKHDVSASSKARADSSLSAPKDLISQTTCNDEGPNKLSLDHMFARTNPSVLVDKTKSTRDGLKTAHTKTGTNLEFSKTEKESKADEDVTFRDDEFNTSSDFSSSNDTKKEKKLKDLYKLVQDVRTDFMDLDLPEDDKPIIVQDDNDEEVHTEKVHTEEPKETADASAPHPPSLSSLPTEVKELPSKFNELTGVVKELIKHVHDLEIELPRDLKEIPTNLKTFTSTVKSGEHVHFTKEQIKEQKRIKESVKVDAAKQEVEARKEEWIDLLGVDVVTKYYKAKLQYDKYYDKILNRRAQSRITNYVVLTRKGPITFKVYREDGTDKTRMDYLYKTEAELRNDLDKPLGEHDPIDRLNDLARKKMKHVDDIFRKDFVTLEDFKDFNNEMLYTVQEIFFRLHQGLSIEDHGDIVGSATGPFSLSLDLNINHLSINKLKIVQLVFTEDTSALVLQKPELRPNKDFEIKYNKVKAKLALLNSGTLSKSSMVKIKGLVAEAYEWDEEDVSSDDNEMTKVKVLMPLANDESVVVGKESARNRE
ncbi:hypothetical protein Tco_0013882 [Tanacetum coccineum]